MRKFTPFITLACCCVATSAVNALPAPKYIIPTPAKPKVEQPPAPVPTVAPVSAEPTFVYRDPSGKPAAIEVVSSYQPKKIVHPLAKVDRRIGSGLIRAATIAQERAHAHSRSRCWHYVKDALLAAGVVNTRPKSEFAKEAASELVANFGFRKLAVRDPYAAPIGSVLVYGSRRAAGHVEIRTREGFVSDFKSKTPSRRPLLGVYTKS